MLREMATQQFTSYNCDSSFTTILALFTVRFSCFKFSGTVLQDRVYTYMYELATILVELNLTYIKTAHFSFMTVSISE